MKYAVLAAGLLAALPFGLVLRSNQRLRDISWVILGLLPWIGVYLPHVNFVSNEWYRGDSRGFEVTLVDLLVVSLFVATPRASSPAPFRLVRYIYLAVALLSLTQAASSLYAAFGVWKLLRMYALLAVVNRGCQDPRVVGLLLRGMTLGSLLQIGMSLYQRYVLHLYQSPGFFAHQNSLGMALNLVLPVSLGLVLAGVRGTFNGVVMVCGLATLVLTLSRGAMASFVMVSSVLFVISAARRLTFRKVAVLVLGVAVAGAMAYKAWDSVVTRFTEAPAGSAAAREGFNAAARLMLADRPLGIGLNNYSLALTDLGYAQRLEHTDAPSDLGEGGVAHHIYWLTAAEMGYPGIVSLVVLLIAPVFLALRYGLRDSVGSLVALLFAPMFLALRNRLRADRDLREDILLALGVGQLAFHLQGFLEWALRQTELSYLFWIVVGLVAALARQIRSGEPAPQGLFGAPAWPIGGGTTMASAPKATPNRGLPYRLGGVIG